MAPTEVRVARPERRWGCRRGTPDSTSSITINPPCSLTRCLNTN